LRASPRLPETAKEERRDTLARRITTASEARVATYTNRRLCAATA